MLINHWRKVVRSGGSLLLFSEIQTAVVIRRVAAVNEGDIRLIVNLDRQGLNFETDPFAFFQVKFDIHRRHKISAWKSAASFLLGPSAWPFFSFLQAFVFLDELSTDCVHDRVRVG